MAKKLSAPQQWLRLKSSPISSGRGLVKMGELVWDFTATPSPLSRTYTLRIRLKRHGAPDVFVLAPDLKILAGGRPLPHVYSTDPIRLCLHYPKYREWDDTMFIADTIVPWTHLWLIYFEHWLATDEWLGGGKHPGED